MARDRMKPISNCGKKCRDCEGKVTATHGCVLCDKCLIKGAVKDIYREAYCPECRDFLTYVYDGKKRTDTVACGRCCKLYELAALHLIIGLMQAKARKESAA